MIFHRKAKSRILIYRVSSGLFFCFLFLRLDSTSFLIPKVIETAIAKKGAPGSIQNAQMTVAAINAHCQWKRMLNKYNTQIGALNTKQTTPKRRMVRQSLHSFQTHLKKSTTLFLIFKYSFFIFGAPPFEKVFVIFLFIII